MNAPFKAAPRGPMPGDRANVPQQFRIFTCTCVLSGAARHTVSTAEVAREVGIGVETVSEAMRFLGAVDLMEGSRGQYRVSAAGLAVWQRWEQDQAQARLLLQALFLRHWPADAVQSVLVDAPVDQEVLGQRLHQGLAGKPRRGIYLVDWLVLALMVCRDEDGGITLSPALQVRAGAAGHGPQRQLPESPGEPDALMGMTNTEIKMLPPDDYCDVLRGITQVLRASPA